MQDVPTFLHRKGLTFECYLDPARPAVVDSSHAVRINYETYLFADEAAVETFLSDYLRYCGFVTDPILKQRFRPHAESPQFEYDGVIYLFLDNASFDAFAADPETHRLPGYKMPKKPKAEGEDAAEAPQEGEPESEGSTPAARTE